MTGDSESEKDTCIGQYSELEMYILKNENILDQLTETFYKTGTDASQFVKITYEFQVHKPNSTANDTDYEAMYDENYEVMDDEIFNCTSQRELYIWSASALYLLGPKPLFWLTFFAVNAPETNVTIKLPCLCDNTHNILLSRVTYLVR